MAQKDLPYWQVEGTKAVVVVMAMVMMVMRMMVADIPHLICIGICFTDITLLNPHHTAIRSIIILT